MRRHTLPLVIAPIVLVSACSSTGGLPWQKKPAEPAVAVQAPTAREEYIGAAPPPPKLEQPGPAPVAGQVWLAGYWSWAGDHHEWTPGHWETPRPGHYWVPYRWQQQGGRWRLYGGYWQKQ